MVGLDAERFASAWESRGQEHSDGPACVVLDVRMPGVSGLYLQGEVTAADCSIRVILITGHHNIPAGIRAMKAGAVGLLPSPFNDQDLLDAIHKAIARDIPARKKGAEAAEIELIRTFQFQEGMD